MSQIFENTMSKKSNKGTPSLMKSSFDYFEFKKGTLKRIPWVILGHPQWDVHTYQGKSSSFFFFCEQKNSRNPEVCKKKKVWLKEKIYKK